MAAIHFDEMANKTSGAVYRVAAAGLTCVGLASAVVIACLIIPFLVLGEKDIKSGEYWD